MCIRDSLIGWDKLRTERAAKQHQLGLLATPLSLLEPTVGPPYAFPDDIKKIGPGEIIHPLPWQDLTDEQRRFQATKMATAPRTTRTKGQISTSFIDFCVRFSEKGLA